MFVRSLDFRARSVGLPRLPVVPGHQLIIGSGQDPLNSTSSRQFCKLYYSAKPMFTEHTNEQMVLFNRSLANAAEDGDSCRP